MTGTSLNSDSAPAAKRWLVLLVLLLGSFMDLIDTTIVNVALPSMRNQLLATPAQLQWIVAAYTLTFGVGMIPAGRLGDRFGHGRLFILGAAAFTVLSVLCGLAPTALILLLARLFQGAAAALMVPQVLSLIQYYFPVQERSRALGAFGAMNGLAAVVGPILAGVLLNANWWGWSWRWVFLINLPIGLITVVLALRLLRHKTNSTTDGLDLWGTSFLSLGILMLLWTLLQGRELGWPLWIWGIGLGGLILLVKFIRWEIQQEEHGEELMLPPSLFRQPSFAAGSLMNLVLVAGVAGLFFVLTITLQNALLWPALRVGQVIVPFSVAVAVGSGLSMLLVRQLGRFVLFAGLGIMALATAGMGWSASTQHVEFYRLALSLGLCGLGMGLVVAPLLNFVLQGTPPSRVGAASGLVSALNPLGQALGVAILGTLFYGFGGSEAGTAALSRTLWVIAGLLAFVSWLSFYFPKQSMSTAKTEVT